MAPGVGVVEAVDVAHKHQKIGPAQPGHHGREGVVVAQHLALAGLDLGRGDRVVLVYHRDDAQLQQGLKGIVQMLGPGGGVHVLPGEENLGHHPVVLPEELVIDVHHHALPHGGGGLLHTQLGGPLLQVHLGGTYGDGAGGDQDDLVPHSLQIGERPGQTLHIVQIQPPRAVGEGGGAHFHYNPQRLECFLQLVHAPVPVSAPGGRGKVKKVYHKNRHGERVNFPVGGKERRRSERT